MNPDQRTLGDRLITAASYRIFALLLTGGSVVQALRGRYVSALLVAIYALVLAVISVSHAVEDRP